MTRTGTRKITVEVPEELLDRAKAEDEGLIEAIRDALELRANRRTWQRLGKWSGKVKWSTSLEELREN